MLNFASIRNSRLYSMSIQITLIGALPLLISTILPCYGEPPPPSSYAVPPREGPSPSYGPPTGGSNPRPPFGGPPSSPPASNYGPPSAGGRPSTGKPSPNGANPSGPGGGPGGNPDSGNEGAQPEPFSFSYEVKDAATGNDYSHKQESDGKTVRGEYKVLLPDGRNQVVTYTADDGGFNAMVKYDGEAQPGPEGPGGAPGAGGAPSSSGSKPGSGGFTGYPSGPPSSPPNSGGYPSGPPGGGSNGYPRGGPPGGGTPASSYLPPSPGGYK